MSKPKVDVRQVMVIRATLDEVVAHLTPKFRNRAALFKKGLGGPMRKDDASTVVNIYSTADPSVWAWTRYPYPEALMLALGLNLVLVRDLGEKPKPALKLV